MMGCWMLFVSLRVVRSSMRSWCRPIPDTELDDQEGRKLRAAQVSIREAQLQLERIDPRLCQKFIDLWQADLAEWRRYLTTLPHLDSVVSALDYLDLDYAMFSPGIC